MAAFRVGPLPEGAIEAAATFYAEVLPLIPPHAGEDLVLIFPPAAHDHRGWRLSAVQDLARAAAPARVNGVVGDDEDAIAGTIGYLERAPGVTGQLLVVGPG
jgi:hypothetical protein